MGGPSELHHDGGGIQRGTPLHDPPEDLHEQQLATTEASVNGAERLLDEGTLSAGRPVHSHPGDQGASVRLTKDLSKFYQRVDAEPLRST